MHPPQVHSSTFLNTKEKLMIRKTISILLTTTLLFSSCSTTRKSIALGISTGAATGAGLGNAMSHDQQGTLTGLAIGAVVGGIASYLIDQGLEKRDEETRQQTLFNLEKYGVFGDSDIANKFRMQEIRESSKDWEVERPNWYKPTPREPRETRGGDRW